VTDLPVVRGEFNLLRKIGEGGMAEVFLAERGGDEGFRTMVALKRLHSGFSLDQYFIRQLVAEARLLGQLQHNNIVRVHDFRRIEDEHFIVMEYIDGIDLAQAIHVHRQHGLTIPTSVFFHLALCLCESLDYAHDAKDLNGRPMELIHRDIKPSNVLMSNRGTVKLTDFGIARVADSTNTGSVVKGTANYMSPEQASGEQDLTPASDIFSLGAVFWEILTLDKLVDGSNYLNVIDSIKVINVGLKDITKRGIEPALRMILLRMLAHKSELRYQSMALVLKDLRFVADQMKVDLSPSHLQEYMSRIIKLARDSAASATQAQQIAPSNPTPVTGPPNAGAPSETAQSNEGGQGFTDSVAALQKLVQTGGDIPPVSPGPSGNAAHKAQPEKPRVAPPSASLPSAPALRAMPELAQVAGINSQADPGASSRVARNTPPPPSREPNPSRPLSAGSLPSAPALRPVSEPEGSSEEITLDEDTVGNWDDDLDEQLASRQANRLVLVIGASAVLILIGVIVWLLSLPPPTQEVTPVVTEAGDTDAKQDPDPPTDDPTEVGPGDEKEIKELVLLSGDAPVDGWEAEDAEPAKKLRSPPQASKRSPDSTSTKRAERRLPAPRIEPTERWEPEPEPEPAAERWEPEPEPEPAAERWEPEPEPRVDEDWIPSSPESGDNLGAADEGSVALASDSDDKNAITASGLSEMASSARRGDLRDGELQSLQDLTPSSELYNSGRALLLAHFEARRDTRAHCEVAVETLRQPLNRAAPQFHLEMSKCHLRQGRHQDALESARVAEMNAQDIPARVRADRQLKIWEVQAKAYKGLYQSTDELDYIADSIAVWKRYLHMAENTYRQRESERATTEIAALEALQGGAL
jgi:serine/threonine protein kinase